MPPNVLIFIMDDQAPEHIAYLDGAPISTPHLDRLAQRGTYLSPYTTVPVCTPGRAEFLTGCNAFQNGCRWFNEPIHSHLMLLPQAFHAAGYHTCHIGKWHNNGHPRDFGYDETHFVFPQDMDVPYNGHKCVFDSDGMTIPRHSTELFGEAAVAFMARAPEDQPWFCYIALHSPHDPRICPEPWMRMYDDKLPPLPPNFMPEHPFDNGDMMIRDELLAGFPRRQDEIRRHRGDYYAMISHHDHHIGRTLAALEDRGQLDNTLVIFTSDHGLAVGSHGLMGKENLYEHSARVPLIMAGPGVPQNRRFDRRALVGHYDFFPTLMDFLNLPVPESVRGLSYVELLREDIPAQGLVGPRTTITAAYKECMRMARDERFKLLYYPHMQRYQLFDLLNDPHETNDLLLPWRRETIKGRGNILNPGYVPPLPANEVDATVERLKAALRVWQAEDGDIVEI